MEYAICNQGSKAQVFPKSMALQISDRDKATETLRRVYRVIMTWPCPLDEDETSNPDNATACDSTPQREMARGLIGEFPNREQHPLIESKPNFESNDDFSPPP